MKTDLLKLRKNAKLNAKINELAELKRQMALLKVEVDELSDELKTYMAKNDLREVVGTEHKIMYSVFDRTTIDSKALERVHPDIYNAFAKTTMVEKLTVK